MCSSWVRSIPIVVIVLSLSFPSCNSPTAPLPGQNRAPECTNFVDPQATLRVGESSTLRCTIVDADGDSVTWTAVIDRANSNGDGSWSPTSGSGPNLVITFTATRAGSVAIVITLTDGKGFATYRGTFIVTGATPGEF